MVQRSGAGTPLRVIDAILSGTHEPGTSHYELLRAFDVRDAIVEAGKRFGFAYVTLDLQGYRTGSHNEVIVGRSLRLV